MAGARLLLPPKPTPPLPSAPPRGVGLALALSVAVNVLTLVGVLALGWPAGNVFLLFWCENVVLGLVTLVRVATAADPGSTRLGSSLFFCVHYGIFCAVHLVFTWLLASALGVDLSWPYLALPVDVVPEALLGPLGLVDDTGVVAVVAIWVYKLVKARQKLVEGGVMKRPPGVADEQ